MSVKGSIKFKGQYHIIIKDQFGNIKCDKIIDNVTTDIYRTVIADNMTNPTPDNTMLASYIAVGTGTNVPAVTDTQLQTETARKLQTSLTNDDNIAAVATLFNAGDIPTSTLKEIGLFSGGSATANSGILISRAAIDEPITSLDSLFVDYRITITDA